MEVCTHEKAVFFLPVNILNHGVVAGFLGRTTHGSVLMQKWCALEKGPWRYMHT